MVRYVYNVFTKDMVKHVSPNFWVDSDRIARFGNRRVPVENIDYVTKHALYSIWDRIWDRIVVFFSLFFMFILIAVIFYLLLMGFGLV